MKFKVPNVPQLLIGALLIIAILYIWQTNVQEGEKIQQAAKLHVAASIFPMYDIVRSIGGDAVDVTLLLPAGNPPETVNNVYAKADLSSFQIIFAFGHGLDDAVLPDSQSKLFIPDKGIDLLLQEGATASPFYYLSGKNGAVIAQNVRDKFIELDPAHEDLYKENMTKFIADIEDVNNSIITLLAQAPQKNIAVYGYDWEYYASAYGLKIISYLPVAPGEKVTATDYESFIRDVRSKKLSAVFSDIYLDSTPLLPLLNDGTVTLLNLNTVGGDDLVKSYAALLSFNTQSIYQGLVY